MYVETNPAHDTNFLPPTKIWINHILITTDCWWVIPLPFLCDFVTVWVGDSVTIPRAVLAISGSNYYIIWSQAKVFLEVRIKFECFGLKGFSNKASDTTCEITESPDFHKFVEMDTSEKWWAYPPKSRVCPPIFFLHHKVTKFEKGLDKNAWFTEIQAFIKFSFVHMKLYSACTWLIFFPFSFRYSVNLECTKYFLKITFRLIVISTTLLLVIYRIVIVSLSVGFV